MTPQVYELAGRMLVCRAAVFPEGQNKDRVLVLATASALLIAIVDRSVARRAPAVWRPQHDNAYHAKYLT